MKKLFILIPTVIILLFASCTTEPKQKATNFIIIFIDDMGYGDVACYGATGWETPNLDKLASEGMRFTNFYAAQPVCSASRAGLLTGCYPNRIGISKALKPQDSVGINPDEKTISEILKEHGYTNGIFGKWHLGHHKKFLPLQNGFDEYVGLPYSNDMWPVDVEGNHLPEGKGRGNYPELPLMNGNEPMEYITTLQDQDRLTTIYTENAIDFINRNASKPFFLYVPHSMGHIPLGVSDKFRGKSKQGFYGDVMMEIDWSVGEIMKTLDQNGIAENTVVIFTTDNGPSLKFGNHAGSAGGLREGKTTSWEGGQRVPFIIRWPGKTPEGTICNKLACAIDILPSITEIAGGKLPENKIDGISVTELWKGNKEADPRQEILFYYGKNNLNAVRKGNWKLVLPHSYQSYNTTPGKDGYGGKRIKTDVLSPELYDMTRDPGEHYNVIDSNPEIVEDLMKVAEAARAELGDLNIGLEKGSGSRDIGRY
jgi:arylsulfatase A-like enzyme